MRNIFKLKNKNLKINKYKKEKIKMNNIQLNKPYNTKELAKAIGTSYSNFSNNKERFLNHLSKFYEFTISKGKWNSIVYTFTKEKQQYSSYKETKRKEKEEKIEKLIIKIIDKNDLQTNTSITDELMDFEEIQELNLSYSTIYSYVSKIVKKMLKNVEIIKEKEYVVYSNGKYTILNEKQRKDLNSIFSEKFENSKSFKESYYNSIQRFKQIYQQIPIRAYHYKINAFYYKEMINFSNN